VTAIKFQSILFLLDSPDGTFQIKLKINADKHLLVWGHSKKQISEKSNLKLKHFLIEKMYLLITDLIIYVNTLYFTVQNRRTPKYRMFL
jgi:hypothetical protein